MKRYYFEVFLEEGTNNGWRWSLIAPNGKIIASSAEAYKNRRHCYQMIEKIQAFASDSYVVERKKE